MSTDDVRIALELKSDADAKLVMAYLFKHTPLQTNFAVNLTCLVPTENPEAGRPERLDLKQMLWHFLHFRLDVVTSRLEHELEQLHKRIHILEGFEKVFDALDEIIAHHPQVRRQGRRRREDHEALRARRGADRRHPRAEALPPGPPRDPRHPERAEGEADAHPADRRAAQGRRRPLERWCATSSSRSRRAYGDKPPRTAIEQADETEYAAEAFIVDEDNVVIVSRDGWVKRQKEVKDLSTTRLREGDSVLAALAGSTRATLVFFTNFGVAYTARFVDVPASTGYGEPVQKLFKFKDGERVVAAFSLDPRAIGDIGRAKRWRRRAGPSDADVPVPPVHALAVTSDGYSLRFSLANVAEPSTRAGRRYARPADGAEVVGVSVVTGDETVIAATRDARAMLCPASEVNFLAGPGKGVILIKLSATTIACSASSPRPAIAICSRSRPSRGAEQTVSTAKYEVTGRGGKGRELLQRGQFTRVVPTPAVLQGWSEDS